VENKRLGHALSIIKAQQNLKPTTTVMTNSEKGGYQKRTRKVHGPPEVTDELAADAGSVGNDGPTARRLRRYTDISNGRTVY
jgi:hypothetical protein